MTDRADTEAMEAARLIVEADDAWRACTAPKDSHDQRMTAYKRYEAIQAADIPAMARALLQQREAVEALQTELSDLADKVRSAGMAGHFEHWEPAYRRARLALKKARALAARKETQDE